MEHVALIEHWSLNTGLIVSLTAQSRTVVAWRQMYNGVSRVRSRVLAWRRGVTVDVVFISLDSDYQPGLSLFVRDQTLPDVGLYKTLTVFLSFSLTFDYHPPPSRLHSLQVLPWPRLCVAMSATYRTQSTSATTCPTLSTYYILVPL